MRHATTTAGTAGGGEADEGHDQSMGTGDWWDGPQRRWSAGARWQACGHGKWARAEGDWADQLEEEEREAGGDDLQPAPARRRLEHDGAAGDQGGGRQQPQQRPQGEGDAEERKRRHEQRVVQIVSMAIDAGVTPLTSSGEELQLLDPLQLDSWVAEHLPAALLC